MIETTTVQRKEIQIKYGMAQVHPLKTNMSPFKGTFPFPKVEYLSSLEVKQLIHQFTQKVIQHSKNLRIPRWGRYKARWSILPLTPDGLTSLIQNHHGLATISEDSNSSTNKRKDVFFSGFSLAKDMATPPNPTKILTPSSVLGGQWPVLSWGFV